MPRNRFTASANEEPAALLGPAADAAQKLAGAMAATLDTYNTGSRRKTLVEQHAERLAAEKKVPDHDAVERATIPFLPIVTGGAGNG